MLRLLAERSDSKSNVKLGGFRSQLQLSYVSSHTEESWYNESVCLWMTIYIYIYIYIYICTCIIAYISRTLSLFTASITQFVRTFHSFSILLYRCLSLSHCLCLFIIYFIDFFISIYVSFVYSHLCLSLHSIKMLVCFFPPIFSPFSYISMFFCFYIYIYIYIYIYQGKE